jgi:ketosteroid isomerase-like protein
MLIKTTHLTILILLTSLCSQNSMAQSDEPDRAELRKLKTAYEQAINSNDLEKLQPFLAESFTGVMVSGEEVKSFSEMKAYWEKMKNLIGQWGTYHVTVNTDLTEFHGDVSISRGITDEEVKTSKGNIYKYHAQWSAVCLKKDGQWKVLRMHSAMDPIQNVFVKAELKGAKTVYGLGGLCAGIMLGFLIFRSKKKS